MFYDILGGGEVRNMDEKIWPHQSPDWYESGLITNYFCTSQCKHCLYASSPHWKKDYITKEILHSNLEKVKSMGCVSLHIGGGEPFLNLDALKQSLEIFKELQTQVEYVETNSSWFKNKETAHKILYSLKIKATIFFRSFIFN